MQSKAMQSKAMQSKAMQSKAMQSKAKHYKNSMSTQRTKSIKTGKKQKLEKKNGVEYQNINWVEKYKPKSIKDLCFNTTSVAKIIKWLGNFNINRRKFIAQDDKKKTRRKRVYNTNNYSCIIVVGPHGVGKTMAVNVVLKSMGWDAIRFDSRGNKKVKEYIETLTSGCNILNFIEHKNPQKKAIIIDEIEAITSTNEKSQIIALQKNNDLNWNCPIIFISNNKHNKFLSDIKKNSYQISFSMPRKQKMIDFVDKIITKENIRIDDFYTKNCIINHAQGDIRRIIFILKDLKCIFCNKMIDINLADEYFQMSKKKDIDTGLFSATSGLLYNYKSIDNCMSYYEMEKVILPLMVHQHYVNKVLSNTEDEEHQFETINKIVESLSIGDVIENYIYGDQNWNIQDVHGFFTCVATSNLMCKGMDNNITQIPLKFTIDLNKTSIQKINKKNINKANECFKNANIFPYTISDYIYLNKIVRKIIQDGDIKGCVKLLKSYNIGLETIASLLKIDKIKDTKTNLTSRQAKEFEKYLEK